MQKNINYICARSSVPLPPHRVHIPVVLWFPGRPWNLSMFWGVGMLETQCNPGSMPARIHTLRDQHRFQRGPGNLELSMLWGVATARQSMIFTSALYQTSMEFPEGYHKGYELCNCYTAVFHPEISF